MKGIRDTSSDTYRQLMGNGLRYEIPKFQRDYSWDTEHWDDLWQDICSLNVDESEHYMGYLVLQSSDNKNFQIIDGQQRLTTMSILILAVLKSIQELADKGIDAEQNVRRKDALMNSYIGYLDPVTLISKSKLKLNRNNDDYYRNYIVPLQNLPLRNINVSEKQMRSCFTWFYERIKKAHVTGESLAGFVDSIVDKLFFTVIKVSDELNAFKVFETLNARGVKLSSADLLKNYLFSVVDATTPHKSELDEMEHLWSKVIGKLGSEKFPEFLRFYWNSLNRTVRKNDLFKAIRKDIKTKGDAFSLIRELNTSADVYMALQNPDDELWKGKLEISSYLRELKLFQIKQPFSLLLATYSSLDESEFKKILRACSIISFRYNVIGGLNPNEQENTYNAVALSIRKNRQFNMNDLRDIYPDDERFETEFANKILKNTPRNHKIAKYIFAEIERYKYHTDIDLNSDLYTVEHILPENPGDAWNYLTEDVIERCVYRLGNLTLLEKNINKDIGTYGFEDKKAAYAKSSIQVTRSINEHYSEWTEETISKRQARLAVEAKSIWRLQF
ncbi:MAG: DUF262 domain-containing HNH endonuclease family protein [Deltaproteobacteria bacterium]|nr:DUF262 domain-containing HNH endonuclease family protein [Deltaproteobacteria bacterium]